MDSILLQETLERLNANLTLLEARKTNRNHAFFAANLINFSGQALSTTGTMEQKTNDLFDKILIIEEGARHGNGWDKRVGNLIYINLVNGNINLEILQRRMENYEGMRLFNKLDILRVIDKVKAGDVDSFIRHS